MKRALVVGIDKYANNPFSPLTGCENDAVAVATTLATNGDGSPNFSVVLLSSDSTDVNAADLSLAVANLFTGDADTVLLYFAGHGLMDPKAHAGYIVSQDGKAGAWGVSLSDIVGQANRAYPHIKSTVIILDSCQSGAAGEIEVLGDKDIAAIGTGVTILTACRRDGTAGEIGGHGIFTSLLLEGLQGTSADVCGRITPASIYSLIDQTLGPWKQRPLYKANVQTFITLRQIAPKIPLEVLRRLPVYFPDATDVFKLDPSCEPDRGEETDKLRHIPVDDDKVRQYREMQACNRYGIVVPVDQPHMWHAAVYSTGCRLTALGAHYRRLAKDILI
ncbi:MAG TPA: caspase family protein [Methylobacter sp.]